MRRRDATKQRLLDAADAYVLAHRNARPPIGSICARAGLTRGAFYSNFDSVEELIGALYRRGAERAEQDYLVLPSKARKSRTPDGVVARILEVLIRHESWRALCTVLDRSEDSEVLSDLKERLARIADTIGEVLEEAASNLDVPLVCAPRSGARLIIGAHTGSAGLAEIDAGALDRPELSALLTRAVFAVPRRRGLEGST